LLSIVDVDQGVCADDTSTDPCIDPIFGPTVAGGGTASTDPVDTFLAYGVSFFGGLTSGYLFPKGFVTPVRAVR